MGRTGASLKSPPLADLTVSLRTTRRFIWGSLLVQFDSEFLKKTAMPAFPHQMTHVEGAVREKLAERFAGAEDGHIQVGPRKFFINASFKDHAEQFYNMEIRKDDVWIVTFPRSGTTWSQELVWLLLNDLDTEKARSIRHHDKVLFLEMSILGGKKQKERLMEELKPDDEGMKFFEQRKIPGYEKAKTMESPRCIKSHLMLSMLPPNLLDTAKVIYVARNPKDVAVSNYYHQKSNPSGFNGEFDQFWPFFEEGITQFGPQVEHVKEAWDLKEHPNMLFYFYEDLKKDLPGMIRKTAQFLGKSISDDQVAKVEKHLSFDNMKSMNDQLGPDFPFKPKPGQKLPGMQHFRKGKSGYDDEFKNVGRRADEWVANQSKRTGIVFPQVRDS